tara:strand:+ start:794 stop:1030 length:237 start_codon:yes stop_codon:yes gene_type:complete
MSDEKNKNSNKPKTKFFSISTLIWMPPLWFIIAKYSGSHFLEVFFIMMGIIILQEKFPKIYHAPSTFLKGLFEEDKNK